MSGSDDDFWDRIPDPDPAWEEAQDWATDALALSEAQNFPNEEELKGQDRANALAVRKHLKNVLIAAVYLVPTLLAIVLVIWLLHFLLPEERAWLDEAQLAKLQTIFSSAFVGSIVTGLVQRYLSLPTDNGKPRL
ncbi:MAG: hypothetical protein AAF788_01720 [Pseudomonadota bacterium]